MFIFFTNLNLIEFQVRYLALFLLFSVIDNFEWFWMESPYKNIQLMLDFMKIPFLVTFFLLNINDLPDDVIHMVQVSWFFWLLKFPTNLPNLKKISQIIKMLMEIFLSFFTNISSFPWWIFSKNHKGKCFQ